MASARLTEATTTGRPGPSDVAAHCAAATPGTASELLDVRRRR
jgi:hypothetical protein